MAIVFNRGSLAPIVGLAKEAGAADRRKEDRARAERQASQESRQRAASSRLQAQLAFQAEQVAQNRAESERRRALTSLDAFQKIDIVAEKELERFERTKAWELNKIDIKRQNDLFEEERIRTRDRQEVLAALTSIEEYEDKGIYPKSVIDQARRNLGIKHPTIPEVAAFAGLPTRKESEGRSFSSQLREAEAAARLPEAREDLAIDNPAAFRQLASVSDPRTEQVTRDFDSLLTRRPPTEAVAQEILDTLVAQGRRAEHRAYLQRWSHLFK